MRHKTKNDIDTCYYNARRSPSVNAMVKYLGLERETALAIKRVLTGRIDLMTVESARKRQLEAYNPHEPLTLALEAVNELMELYGVEYIASKADTMHEVQGVEYINTGETYNLTMTYDYRDDLWRISSWGNYIELEPERFKD